jgi:hypothetical protein
MKHLTKRRMITAASKSSYVSPNRGLALLDEAIDQIELHAKAGDKGQWYQGDYRCGSGMCLAGWIGQLAGGQWATAADSWQSSHMVREPDDAQDGSGTYTNNQPVVHVAVRAQRLADLTGDQAHALFAGENDLHDIKEMRDQIAAGTWDAWYDTWYGTGRDYDD